MNSIFICSHRTCPWNVFKVTPNSWLHKGLCSYCKLSFHISWSHFLILLPWLLFTLTWKGCSLIQTVINSAIYLSHWNFPRPWKWSLIKARTYLFSVSGVYYCRLMEMDRRNLWGLAWHVISEVYPRFIPYWVFVPWGKQDSIFSLPLELIAAQVDDPLKTVHSSMLRNIVKSVSV